jgi:hypothetical protein
MARIAVPQPAFQAVGDAMRRGRASLPKAEPRAAIRGYPLDPFGQGDIPMAKLETTNGVQGEGDYASARNFQEDQRRFVRSGAVEGNAREAAEALDGPEGAKLEAARRASAKGESVSRGKGKNLAADAESVPDESNPHTEKNLDKGLEETFPASDPVSISPGTD